MSRKLKVVSILAAALMLLPGCGDRESPPISEDLAYEYVWRLEDYVAKTGDEYILYDFLDDMDYWYILESMNHDLLLEFMEDYLAEAYSEGYCDGERYGYAVGYIDGEDGALYEEDMLINGEIP